MIFALGLQITHKYSMYVDKNLHYIKKAKANLSRKVKYFPSNFTEKRDCNSKMIETDLLE